MLREICDCMVDEFFAQHSKVVSIYLMQLLKPGMNKFDSLVFKMAQMFIEKDASIMEDFASVVSMAHNVVATEDASNETADCAAQLITTTIQVVNLQSQNAVNSQTQSVSNQSNKHNLSKKHRKNQVTTRYNTNPATQAALQELSPFPETSIKLSHYSLIFLYFFFFGYFGFFFLCVCFFLN